MISSNYGITCSGDAFVQTNHSNHSVFINSGHNPFELIKSSIMYVFLGSKHLLSSLLSFLVANAECELS